MMGASRSGISGDVRRRDRSIESSWVCLRSRLLRVLVMSKMALVCQLPSLYIAEIY
jgi:hypothetical protein